MFKIQGFHVETSVESNIISIIPRFQSSRNFKYYHFESFICITRSPPTRMFLNQINRIVCELAWIFQPAKFTSLINWLLARRRKRNFFLIAESQPALPRRITFESTRKSDVSPRPFMIGLLGLAIFNQTKASSTRPGKNFKSNYRCRLVM